MAKKRSVFRIQLTSSAAKRLQGVTKKTGISQIAVTSKLLEWFAGQPAEVKAVVLDLYPQSIAADVSELILKRAAARQGA